PACSMARRSEGLSTTHRVPVRRSGLSQIRHISVSEKFWQLSHLRTLSIAWLRALARRTPPDRPLSSKWNAMRWAVFWPTHGKHRRKSTNSTAKGLNAMNTPQRQWQTGSDSKRHFESGRHAHTGHHAGHFILLMRLHAAYCIVHRSGQKVFKDFLVLGK